MSNQIKAETFKEIVKELIEKTQKELGRPLTAEDIAVVKQKNVLLPTGEFTVSVVPKEEFAKKFTEGGPIFKDEVSIVDSQKMSEETNSTPSVKRNRPK